MLTGDINIEKAVFNLRIYNPDGDLIRTAINTTHSGLTFEAIESGSYRVEIENPNLDSIMPYIYIGRDTVKQYRPLSSAGQWLSLISIPIFILGLWASRMREI